MIIDSLLQWASLEFPLVLIFSHEKSLRFCLIANHSFLQTLLTKYLKTHHGVLLDYLNLHLGTDLLLLIEQRSQPLDFVTLLELISLACKIILSIMDCITEQILRFHITNKSKIFSNVSDSQSHLDYSMYNYIYVLAKHFFSLSLQLLWFSQISMSNWI